MKIGVWLKEDLYSDLGGGFSYYVRLCENIDAKTFIYDLNIIFITENQNLDSNKYEKEVLILPEFAQNKLHRLKKNIKGKIPFIGKYYHRKYLEFEKRQTDILRINYLKKNSVGFIFYPLPGHYIVKDFPFVVLNWDIGHRTTFPFPELTAYNNYKVREDWYNSVINKALLVFSESEAGKSELVKYSNLSPIKVEVLPLFASKMIDLKIDDHQQSSIIKELNINEKFFFYPAQLWAHKNHWGLLNAFCALIRDFPEVHLVLTGSDKGNRDYIENIIKDLDIALNVHYLGFVSSSLMYTFYKKAIALVFPSYLGPTNIPPLEALELECPIICSGLEGHKEMLKDAAYYFDPSDFRDIERCMRQILISENRNNLIDVMIERKETSIFNINYSINVLEKTFIKLRNVRNCWN